MKYLNTIVLSAVDTSSQNGPQIDSNQLISASFQTIFGDATAAGTIKIQASNDPAPTHYTAQSNFTVTNWVDIPSATATITSGASSIITIPQLSYRWLRAVYTRSSGGSTTIIVKMMAVSL